MARKSSRRPYWRKTKLQLVASFVLPAAAIVTLLFYANELNSMRIFGFPLGYFAVSHIGLLVAILATLRFVARQDEVDRSHGASEEI